MKNIAVLALIGLLSKSETTNAINLNRLEKSNICISEIHEDTESLLGLDSSISIDEEPAAAEGEAAKPDPKKEEAEAKSAEEETKTAKVEAEKTEKEAEAKNDAAVKAVVEGPKDAPNDDEKIGKTEVNVTGFLRK